MARTVYSMLVFLLLLGYSRSLRAQQPLLRHYTVQDGLPSNVIYYIFQDSRGFIWFGTDQGISRFDGHQFHNYSTTDGLPDNEIFSVTEDNLHRYWINCYNHKPCYMRNGKFYTSSNDALCRHIEASGISYENVFQNMNGDYGLGGTKIGLLSTDSFRLIYPAVTQPELQFSYFIFRGTEYIMNASELFSVIRGQKKVILTGRFIDILLAGTNLYIHRLYVNNDNTRTYCMLYYAIRGDTLVLIKKTVFPYRTHRMYLLPDSNIRCCTENGLLTYDRKQGTFTRDTSLLFGIPVNQLMSDKEGNSWYITANDGVYMQLKAAPQIYNKSSGLHSSNVMAVGHLPGGKMLAGYNSGDFSVLDTGHCSYYISGIKSNYNRNRLRFIYKTGADEYVVGSDQGLFSINNQSKTQVALQWVACKASVFRNGHCLVGTSYNAFSYEVATRKQTELWTERTTAIEEDAAGIIWLGTLNGLYYRSKGGSLIRKYDADTTLAHARITGLGRMAGNRLLISTGKEGLYILTANNTLQHLRKQDGLSSDNCKKVIADSAGTIWLCTDKGIDRISFLPFFRYHIYHYTQADGLITSEVNDFDVCNGHLYVGTSEGLIALSKEPATVHMTAPEVYLTGINNNDTMQESAAGRVTFPYRHNNLQFSFTGISFAAGKDIVYKYFLDGGSTDTVITTQNSVNFSVLPPGSYTFYVWAGTREHRWSMRPAIYNFQMLPAFWQTWWFRLGTFLLAASCIILGYRRRIRNIRAAANKSAARKRRLAEMELRALRAQVNPHFIFNALNAIQNYYSRNDELNANHYMTSFAQLMRKMLSFSEANWITLKEEISLLSTYVELEQIRFAKAFRFHISQDPEIDAAGIQVPAMLIQPYVENAINHGLRHLSDGSGKLLLTFLIDQNTLICTIDDNGIGFHAAQQNKQVNHQSFGMHINRQRIDMINQTYHTAISLHILDKAQLSTGQSGTIITISIPVKNIPPAHDRINRR